MSMQEKPKILSFYLRHQASYVKCFTLEIESRGYILSHLWKTRQADKIKLKSIQN